MVTKTTKDKGLVLLCKVTLKATEIKENLKQVKNLKR